jgi:hypothetical protein
MNGFTFDVEPIRVLLGGMPTEGAFEVSPAGGGRNAPGLLAGDDESETDPLRMPGWPGSGVSLRREAVEGTSIGAVVVAVVTVDGTASEAALFTSLSFEIDARKLGGRSELALENSRSMLFECARGGVGAAAVFGATGAVELVGAGEADVGAGEGETEGAELEVGLGTVREDVVAPPVCARAAGGVGRATEAVAAGAAASGVGSGVDACFTIGPGGTTGGMPAFARSSACLHRSSSAVHFALDVSMMTLSASCFTAHSISSLR